MTHPEKAIVTGIVLVVITLMLTSAWAFFRNHIGSMMTRDFQALEVAVFQYERIYRRMPSAADSFRDTRFGGQGFPSNAELIAALRSSTQTGTGIHPLNPEDRRFVDIAPAGFLRSGLNPKGEFVDPFGQPYMIALDMDRSNSTQIPDSSHGLIAGRKVAVWSVGLDGLSDTRDDYVSWTE
jgi:hypothetical protein